MQKSQVHVARQIHIGMFVAKLIVIQIKGLSVYQNTQRDEHNTFCARFAAR